MQKNIQNAESNIHLIALFIFSKLNHEHDCISAIAFSDTYNLMSMYLF